jgi:flagellar biosynthesis chaperone FliJ
MTSMLTKLGVAAAIGVVLSVTIYSLSSSSSSKKSSSSSKKKKSNKSKTNKGDACSLDTALQVFGTIQQNIMMIKQSLAAYEAQVRERAAGQVTEEQLRDHMNETFVKELVKIERQIYEKYQVAESQVQAAVKVYGDEPRLKKLLADLKKNFELVRQGGEGGGIKPSDLELPKGFDRAKILEIFKRVMGNIIETIAVVGKQLAPDGGKIDTALIPQFNMMFGKATESTAAGIAKEYNVTPMVSGWWCGWCCCCCIGGVVVVLVVLLLYWWCWLTVG